MFGLAVVPRDNVPLGGRVLSYGMRGRDVRELQNFLAGLDLYRGPVDGKYGALTEQAVADLQRLLGLKADGRVGGELLRACRRPELFGLWIVHQSKKGESLEEIAGRYLVKPQAIRNTDGKTDERVSGRVVFIPRRELWIWLKESRPSFACSAQLVEAGGQVEPEAPVPVKTVVRGEDLLAWRETKPPAGRERIVDGRRLNPGRLRRVIRKSAVLFRSEPFWIWLNDSAFELAGALSDLNLRKRKRNIAGVILDITPTAGAGRRGREKRTAEVCREAGDFLIMYSLDLRPRIVSGGSQRHISLKEARHLLYRRESGEIGRRGRFAWAALEFAGKTGREELWFADKNTLHAVFRRVVRENLAGAVLEGLTGVDPRLFDLRREYFALLNSGHETSLQDIYLKKEKNSLPRSSGDENA